MFNILILLTIINWGLTCQIAGHESGVCVSIGSVASQIPFCSKTLSGYVCVPQDYELWPSFGIKYKDNLVQKIFMEKIEKVFLDEAATMSSTSMKLSTNTKCFSDYKTFMCNWNFPNCSPQEDRTLAVCLQLCLNYHSNCGLNEQLCNVNFDDAPGLDTSCASSSQSSSS